MGRRKRAMWWEPYRATVRASVAELRATGVLRARVLVRAAVIAAVAIGVNTFALRHVEVRREWVQVSHGVAWCGAGGSKIRSVDLEEVRGWVWIVVRDLAW